MPTSRKRKRKKIKNIDIYNTSIQVKRAKVTHVATRKWTHHASEVSSFSHKLTHPTLLGVSIKSSSSFLIGKTQHNTQKQSFDWLARKREKTKALEDGFATSFFWSGSNRGSDPDSPSRYTNTRFLVSETLEFSSPWLIVIRIQRKKSITRVEHLECWGK